MTTMDNPLQLLRDRHGFNLSDQQLQKIVNTCAEIIVIQDQAEQDEGNQKAAAELGWMDDDEEEDDDGHDDDEPYCYQCGVQLFGYHSRPFCDICL